jgi:hypothetical protein
MYQKINLFFNVLNVDVVQYTIPGEWRMPHRGKSENFTRDFPTVRLQQPAARTYCSHQDILFVLITRHILEF